MVDRRIFTVLVAMLLVSAFVMPASAAGQNSAPADEATSTIDLADGPYVEGRGPGDWRGRMIESSGDVIDAPIAANRIEVPGVAGVPAFAVDLRPVPATASSVEPLAADAPLFVLADTHGEYPILTALLKAQGIVNDELAWSFGNGQLVVTGDMLDRGPHHLEILWLLYKLEAEAQDVGGRVHVLLGNHETMVLRGDQRYLNPRYPEVARRLGASAYSELLGPDTVIGAWLRSRPAVLKLGELLLLHGGISPELSGSTLSLDAINDTVRRYLDIPYAQRPADGSDDALVMGSNGPLWYRGYFRLSDNPPAATDFDVASSLARFDASRILVGHTIVGKVQLLYGDKVIAVQVYPHIDETSRLPILEGAARLDGKWYRATAQGERLELNPAK